MTSNPHIPPGYARIQTSISDYASSSSSNRINNINSINNINNNDDEMVPEYTNFEQSVIQKLNSIQYKNQMDLDSESTSNQGIVDYEEYSLNQSAAEVLTDSGILALHVLSNMKNPTVIRQRMKRYLSKINPDK